MKVKLSDIISALESADQFSDYYLDRETGEIEMVNDMFTSEEEKAEIRSRLDHHGFYRLPKVGDIDSYGLMVEFIETRSGQTRERLAAAIKGKGAFSRFKDALFSLGIRQEWYDFKADLYRRTALQWCEEKGIAYEE